MDLHELFEAFHGAGAKQIELVIGVDPGAGDDHTVYRCSCGYLTEILEVMAIHQVRVHNFPIDTPAFNAPRVAFVNAEGQRIEYWEADQPIGPWTRCVDGIVRKRYANMRYSQF